MELLVVGEIKKSLVQVGEIAQGNIAVALEKQLVENKEELGKSDIANFAEVPFSERKKKKKMIKTRTTMKMITITKNFNLKSKKPSKK